jgi:hypothetical protein
MLEIRDVLVTWNRAIDRGDVELLASTYAGHAYDDHGQYRYKSAREAASDYVARHLRWAKRHFHTTVQEHIELDGDVAHCESYAIAYLVTDRIAAFDPDVHLPGVDELLITVGIRYVDRFERVDGAWKIAMRDMITEWRTFSDSVPIEVEIPGQRLGFFRHPYRGSRSLGDPAYDMTGWLGQLKERPPYDAT